jgi:hypothetical protein
MCGDRAISACMENAFGRQRAITEGPGAGVAGPGSSSPGTVGVLEVPPKLPSRSMERPTIGVRPKRPEETRKAASAEGSAAPRSPRRAPVRGWKGEGT